MSALEKQVINTMIEGEKKLKLMLNQKRKIQGLTTGEIKWLVNNGFSKLIPDEDLNIFIDNMESPFRNNCN